MLAVYVAGLPGVVRTGPCEFRNDSGTPWFVLSFYRASPEGNFSSSGEPPESCNLVELIGSSSVDRGFYSQLMATIARFLNWELVDVSVDAEQAT
jgi:hypothetical protein